MAWFKVDDKLHSAPKLLSIPRKHRLAALGLWTISGSWSADQLTDGIIPDYMVDEWGGTKTLVDWLVKSDLWQEVESGNQFKNWNEYQPTKADVESDREKNREKLRKWRERNQVSNEGVTGLQDGSKPIGNPAPDPTRPDPTIIKDSLSEVADAPSRPEIDDLLNFLDEGIEYNGLKKPARTKKNHDAIRLLLDRDGYKQEQVRWIIQWACNDEFWRPNILSASKLREKFPQLMAKAGVSKQMPAKAGFNGEIDPDAILGKDYWVPGTPPADLTIQEEMAWKDQQISEHRISRIAEAQRRVINE